MRLRLLCLLLPVTALLGGLPAAQGAERTGTGFYYPTGSAVSRGTPFLAGAPGHPSYWPGRLHTGRDIPGTARVTPVLAVADGEVVGSSMDLSYYGSSRGAPGGAVLMRHETSAGPVYAVYGHIVPLEEGGALPPKGARVAAGKPFARVGPYDQGEHLHFGIRPGRPDPDKPYRGFAVLTDPPDTHGWVDPIEFIRTHSPGASSSEGTDTVIVLDCSESMSRLGPDGERKLASAQRAARDALEVVRFDAEQLGHPHRVGLVGFSDDVVARVQPTADLDMVRHAVERLRPVAHTNFGDPLDLAISYLEGGRAERRVILFLSDGMTNAGPVARDRFLVDRPDDFDHPLRLYQRLRDSRAALYAMGFGRPGVTEEEGCDEEVLRRLAEVPGTGGVYHHARDGLSLDRMYVQSIHQATGKLALAYTGEVAQGERKESGFALRPATMQARRPGLSLFVTPAYAGSSEGQLLVTLGWTVGKLGLELRDPRGRLVDAAYPGTHLRTEGAPLCIAVDAPMAGRWEATVIGEKAPRGPVRYHLLASARLSRPVPAGSAGAADDWQGLALLVELAAIMALVAACIAVRRRQHRPPMWWVQVSGPGQPRWVHGLPLGTLLLGRDPHAGLCLADPAVSWRHAQLTRRRNGVLLRDLGSANGTRVNGEVIVQRWLQQGDVVTLGHSRLTLLADASARAGERTSQTTSRGKW